MESEFVVEHTSASPSRIEIVGSLPHAVPFLMVRTSEICELVVNWRFIRFSRPQFVVITAFATLLVAEVAADLLHDGTLEIFMLFR